MTDLSREPFLATHLMEWPGVYDTTLKLCHAAGFEPNIVSRLHQFATIVGLVAAGRGIALVPESVSKLTLPGVVYAELDQCKVTSDVAIAFRVASNAPATQRLLDLCGELGGEAGQRTVKERRSTFR